MPAGILIDVDRRIVFTHAVNPLTAAQIGDHRTRLHSDPRFDPQFCQIISFLEVTDVELSTDQLRGVARQAVFAARSRRAFIMPNDVLFGLGRMFATLRELAGESHIKVVRTVSEAADWVGVDHIVAQRAFDTLRSSLKLDA